MAATCHELGILPVVTFHHFTNPRWLAAAGTWEAPHAPDRFARFCERVTAHMGDLIGMACTLNEPNVVATMGWRLGLFPPRVRDRARRDAVNAAMVPAHRKAVEAIRSGPGTSRWAHRVDDRLPAPAGRRGVARAAAPAQRGRVPRGHRGRRLRRRPDLHPDAGRARRARSGPRTGCRTTQMGYEFWPEALEATIRRATEVTGGCPSS